MSHLQEDLRAVVKAHSVACNGHRDPAQALALLKRSIGVLRFDAVYRKLHTMDVAQILALMTEQPPPQVTRWFDGRTELPARSGWYEIDYLIAGRYARLHYDAEYDCWGIGNFRPNRWRGLTQKTEQEC